MRAQKRFEGSIFKEQRAFGGTLLKRSHAKTKRAVSTREPMHVVLKSALARGARSMRAPAHLHRVSRILREDSTRCGVRIIQFANVGNHLHLLVKASNRRAFLWFLRSFAGRLAMLLTGARKGDPLPKGQKFWDQRPFSRIVAGRRGYALARDYVMLNWLEAEGVVPPRAKRAG